MDDPLVLAFRSLCDQQGGYRRLAERIDAGAQSLYQVYAGIRLPSGQPRGVGPSLRRKLDDRFPGWRGVNSPRQNQPEAPGLGAEPRRVVEHSPLFTWDELMARHTAPPGEFSIELPDDSLGPQAPAGTLAIFSSSIKPMPGDAVLIRDDSARWWVRVYHQSLEHGWEGKALSPAYASIPGSRAKVEAVLTGIKVRFGQIAR